MGYVVSAEDTPLEAPIEVRGESVVLLDVHGKNIFPYGHSVEITYEYMVRLGRLYDSPEWREAITTGRIKKIQELGA